MQSDVKSNFKTVRSVLNSEEEMKNEQKQINDASALKLEGIGES